MKKQIIKISILVLILIAVLTGGYFLLKENYIYMIKWWVTLIAVGLISFPTFSMVFKKFDDRGWMFSKILGLGISGLILWNLSYLKILKFNSINSYIILGSIAFINLIVLIARLVARRKKAKGKIVSAKASKKELNKEEVLSEKSTNEKVLNEKSTNPKKGKISNIIINILIIEIIFLIAFTIWVYIRSFNPVLNENTEHFMNYGFINKIMNSDYLPVEDIWLSGNTINYYYYGQYITAFLNKISMTHVEESYNLMIALLASCLFTLAYSIGKTLGKNLIKDNTKKLAKTVPIAIAILAGLSTCLGGTTYYPIYRWALQDQDYFFADPCYYIGYRPDVPDKTITAFPSYMNIAGDLHAHYFDTMFALTMLALLLQYMLSEDEKSTENIEKLEDNKNQEDTKNSKDDAKVKISKDGKKIKRKGRWKKIFNLNIILMGVLLAIQKMTNYWDLPIYLVIIGAVVTVKNFIKYKKFKQKILVTLAQLVEVVVLEELLSLTFSMHLYISATQVHFTNIMSPMYKLIVLWGLPTLCVIANIITLLYKYFKEKKGSIFDYINRMNLSDVYVIIIGVCAIGLVLLPEIIYLKDIYSDEYKRANTMFKLTFNAITLFHISTSYILIKHIFEKSSVIKKTITIIILIVFLTTICYGIDAIGYMTVDLKNNSMNLRSVENHIKTNLPDDYEAIQWIKENIDRDAIILEKSDGSYTISTRISAFTANATVLAWQAHEWVWRANPDYSMPEELAIRWNDIYQIYTSQDKDYVKSLIEKYNISYIYIGNVEYSGYTNTDFSVLLSLGDIVYKKDENYVMSPVYIVKCK